MLFEIFSFHAPCGPPAPCAHRAARVAHRAARVAHAACGSPAAGAPPEHPAHLPFAPPALPPDWLHDWIHMVCIITIFFADSPDFMRYVWKISCHLILLLECCMGIIAHTY